MTLLDMVLVALVTGIAEVLPLGAAAHLSLLPAMRGSPDQLAAVAAAADLGIVAGLAACFWRDLAAMAVGLWRLVKGRPDSGTRLLVHLLLGTLPVLLLDWAVARVAPHLDGRILTAVATTGFGLLLLGADRLGMTVRRLDHLTWVGALAIGTLQALALVPGVARVGVTVTAARLLGYERTEAARLALLLSMPLLAGSALSLLWRLRGELVVSSDLSMAAAVAGGAALVAALGMTAWVRRNTFTPFAVWRVLLGMAMLAAALWR